MTKTGARRRWLWAVVCAAGVGAAILLYVATRPGPPVEPVPPDEPVLEEEAVDPPAPEAPGWVDEPGEPVEFPEGVRWLTEDTFVETGRGGRGMVSRWDADGDGLYDADEWTRRGGPDDFGGTLHLADKSAFAYSKHRYDEAKQVAKPRRKSRSVGYNRTRVDRIYSAVRVGNTAMLIGYPKQERRGV